MAQDVRVLKSNGAVNKTIAAVHYQAERLRQRCGDLTPDHNEILGAAVDLHHRNMSFLTSTLKSTQLVESRNSSLAIFEVDDFEDDDEDAGSTRMGTSPAVGQLLVLDPAPSPLETADTIVTLKNTGVSKLIGSKKITHDVAPAMLLRRMHTASPSVSQPMKSFVGSLSQLDDVNLDDDEPIFKEWASSRCKSFLLRTDQSGSAADEMLAQIRGSKWASDSIYGSKSARSVPPRPSDPLLGGSLSRSGSRNGSMLSPSGTSPSASGLPLVTSSSVSGLPTIATKSFTAGKRPMVPGVSVDGSIPPIERATTPSPPGLPKASSVSSPRGLLSKLRKVVKI